MIDIFICKSNLLSPIQYCKSEEGLKIEIERIDRGEIEHILEIKTHEILNNDLKIVPMSEITTKIAPHYIRDYEVLSFLSN